VSTLFALRWLFLLLLVAAVAWLGWLALREPRHRA
jgi:hypothetical protein